MGELQSNTLYGALKEAGLPVGSANFIRVASIVIRYALRVDSAYDCQRDLKQPLEEENVDLSAQKFRLVLSDMSYIHLNLKFFCLNLLRTRMTNESLFALMTSFGIHRNDVVLVRKVFEQRGYQSSLKKHDRVKEIKRDQITKAAFDKVYSTFNVIYPEIMQHIKSRVYTKLRFVSVSSNMEFTDFHMELVCKALQTYIKMVPTDKSELYIANYIRRSLSNHTTNMIKTHTCAKRKRMHKGKSDGFGGFEYEIPVLSENQLLKAFGIDGLNYEDMQSVEVSGEQERVGESWLSYELILRNFGTTKKRRTLIELISGKESDQFTDYLRESNLIGREDDNVDFSESAGTAVYFSTVCSFLRISEKKARRFVDRLGRTVYPERYALERTNAFPN